MSEKFFRSRTGFTFGLLYLGLYLLSGIYAVCMLVFGRPAPEFNPPAIAGLPWSLPLILLSHSLGIGNLYDRLTGSPVLYGILMTLVPLPGALLNAGVLYAFCKFLDRFRGTKN